MATFPDSASLAELRQRDVRFIIVHGDLFDDVKEYEQTLKSLDHHPQLELVASEPWQERETRMYRLRPAAPNRSSQRF
jgi:UDP-2,3-diacylglucosamine pyrophosphatase LpxH